MVLDKDVKDIDARVELLEVRKKECMSLWIFVLTIAIIVVVFGGIFNDLVTTTLGLLLGIVGNMYMHLGLYYKTIIYIKKNIVGEKKQ